MVEGDKTMVCTTPPELSDEQILQFLDEEADPDIGGDPITRQHLETCDHCREKADRLRAIEGQLRKRLYRADCPDPHTLGEYKLNLLPQDTTRQIRQHLAHCPHCSRELAGLAGYLEELKPDIEISPLDRLRVLVARLAEAGAPQGRPAMAPALAGLRGEQAGPQLYEAGEMQISLDIQADPARPAARMVVGLVFGIETVGFRGSLVAEKGATSQVQVDHLGNFMFSGLDPGEYHLILTGPDAEVHIDGLQV
jgi:anti-sigma factor RsiW